MKTPKASQHVLKKTGNQLSLSHVAQHILRVKNNEIDGLHELLQPVDIKG
jgi:hypothetical protein